MLEYTFAVIAMIAFSFNQICNKKLTLQLNTYNAFLAREMYRVILLIILTLFIGHFSVISLKSIIIIIIGGIAGFIAFEDLLISYSYLPVGIAITIANTFPFFTLLFTTIFNFSFITLNQLLIMILVFIGIIITVYKKSDNSIKQYKKFIFPLITAIGWGTYYFCIYTLTEQNINAFNISLYIESMVLISLIMCILFKNNFDRQTFSKNNFKYAFFSAFTSTIGILLVIYAIKTINPAIISSIVSVQLALITILSIPIFKENISVRQWIGIFIVLGGLILYKFI